MQKTNYQHKNYTEIRRYYQMVLPLNIEMLIPEDDSVRLLSQILEGLNYDKLYMAYSSFGRKPAVEPKILFKILTYAYMNNIYASRKIENCCKRDINFMWLLQGNKAPEHSTISRFRKYYLPGAAEDLFCQLVKHLKEIEELNFENLFVDGTKIEANANRYTFVWKKAIAKNEEKMFVKIQTSIDKINEFYKTNFRVEKSTIMDDLEGILKYLYKKKEVENTKFVHGTGRRKPPVQKFIESVETFYNRQEKYNLCNNIFHGRNSYSKTDPDATFMHMKEDHMRNSQLKPGYNVQIGVEGEYVIAADIFDNRSDSGTLIPFLDGIRKNLGVRYKNIVADSGYESEENYTYIAGHGQNYYIKPNTYEKWKKRSFKSDISKRENMKYDPVKDEYTCHNGNQLKAAGKFLKKSQTGYRAEITVYECENCTGCIYKSKCTRALRNRKIYVSKKFINERRLSYRNIKTEKGIRLRVNRSIQVEGAFGVLKENYNFKRFLTRGKRNVRTEFILLCFGYDVNKLHNKIQNGRCGQTLHKLKTA